ncbi:MAG: hypothetical protein D6718_03805 [Acidobacteria bacterium]|nr:MAG: hypothetical protein D6718_03805 [Acidobacteriota bacterium]
MKRSNWIRALFAVVALAAIVVGAAATVNQTYAKPSKPSNCYCPMVWDPVVCSNGHVYSNLCVAHCWGATGCKPAGPRPW